MEPALSEAKGMPALQRATMKVVPAFGGTTGGAAGLGSPALQQEGASPVRVRSASESPLRWGSASTARRDPFVPLRCTQDDMRWAGCEGGGLSPSP